MKKLFVLLLLVNCGTAFATYTTNTPPLSPSPTQQRLQNEMSTQQQLHQQQLHTEQQNSAQQLQQNNQLHQQQMLNRVQKAQP